MNNRAPRSFRPTIAGTLFLSLLAVLFASLGTWQTRRAAEKTALEAQFRDAARLPLATAIERDERFARVEAAGHYDTARHILLDNQLWQGRGGVHVFTPFTTRGGEVVLVNRGWLPLPPDRRSLPDVPTPAQQVVLTGLLNLFPVPGRQVGEADVLAPDRWPQLVTYMNQGDIERVLGLGLEDRIVQLSPENQHGFAGRDWKPSFMSAERHRGYAVQWFALTAACVVLWLATGFRKSPGSDA
jgi:surfeit locus 1 family protein